jgi:hypothetical protein
MRFPVFSPAFRESFFPYTHQPVIRLAAVGVELDAIAAVVIGGTLLTGGAGFVAGTLIGLLIQGLIQTYITFDGTLSSWWTKILIGAAAVCIHPDAEGHSVPVASKQEVCLRGELLA